MTFVEDLIRHLLAEVDAVDVRQLDPAGQLVERRLKLCEMVLADVTGDDLEGLAVRGLAGALADLSITYSPDPGQRAAVVAAVERFIAARTAHLEQLRARWGGDSDSGSCGGE